MPDIIKVSANSVTTAVAGAIAGVIRDHGGAAVQAIGASAVNQAVKAIAIAHGYLEEEDVSIVCVPGFVEVDINGQERTAIRFDVEVLARHEGHPVLCRQGPVVAAAFHPELSDDVAVHRPPLDLASVPRPPVAPSEAAASR